MHNFSKSRHKFGCIYMLTPEGLPEKSQPTIRFSKRKLAACNVLLAEVTSAKSAGTQPNPCNLNPTERPN